MFASLSFNPKAHSRRFTNVSETNDALLGIVQKMKDVDNVSERMKNMSTIQSQKVKELSEQFFNIGFCGKEENERLINEFKEVRDGFYKARQNYFVKF